MKKTVIIIAIVVFVIGTIIFATKRILQLTAQTFDLDSFDIPLNSVGDYATFALSGANGDLNLVISNFAKKGYTIDNLNVEIYSLDGKTLLAYQANALSEPIEIEGNKNNIISLPFRFKGALVTTLFNQVKDKYDNVIEVVQNYLNKNKFGTEVLVRGFVMKKGVKIPFEITKAV